MNFASPKISEKSEALCKILVVQASSIKFTRLLSIRSRFIYSRFLLISAAGGTNYTNKNNEKVDGSNQPINIDSGDEQELFDGSGRAR